MLERTAINNRYQQILQNTKNITQSIAAVPHPIAQQLAQRRQKYQQILNEAVAHIINAKNFVGQKQKQQQNRISEYKVLKQWVEKRNLQLNRQLQRQQSLKYTLQLVKQAGIKVKSLSQNMQEIRRIKFQQRHNSNLSTSQYGRIVEQAKQPTQSSHSSKPAEKLNQSRKILQTMNESKQNKKQVSFINNLPQSHCKLTIKLSLKNETLKLQTNTINVKQYELVFRPEKEIFVNVNGVESREASMLLWNFNYHKDIAKLNSDIQNISH